MTDEELTTLLKKEIMKHADLIHLPMEVGEVQTILGENPSWEKAVNMYVSTPYLRKFKYFLNCIMPIIFKGYGLKIDTNNTYQRYDHAKKLNRFGIWFWDH